MKAEVKVEKAKVPRIVVERIQDEQVEEQLQQLLKQRENLVAQLHEVNNKIVELREKHTVRRQVMVESLVARIKCSQCGATSTMVLKDEGNLKNIRKVRCSCGAVLELT